MALSKEDEALLTAFARNTDMFNAVRRALLVGMIGDEFDRKNWIWTIDRDKKLSDAAFAREVKVTRTALEWINAGFDGIARLVQSNPHPDTTNGAR